MAKATLYQFGGGESEIEIDSMLAEGEINTDLIHQAVQVYLTNQRQGTRATKTRSQVAGSGKKPWPQKHTGRARHGDRQSPLWAGGGVTFGPQPKNFVARLPKKMKQRALASAIRDRFQSDSVVVVDKLEFDGPKTSEAAALLERVGLGDGKRVLVLVAQNETGSEIWKSFRNIPGVSCAPAMGTHPYEILNNAKILITEGGLEELVSRVN